VSRTSFALRRGTANAMSSTYQ